MTKNLILGTAGHIDHGKTSLIRALTGTDTDRLPEEKKRGITIELGYAVLEIGEFRLGIVDVPGHEKFVRQMLSGATGMDLVLLVVAADDSVKRQTLEHLDILRLLDLPAGVIALTKCDLVETDWLDLVTDEVREQVKGTFLENVPIVRTSVVSGAGIDDLKTALLDAAHHAQSTRQQAVQDAPFRMAIDRVFTIEGHGTVVTGSVSSGRINIGDQLEIQPGAVKVRVREIQNHDRTVEQLSRGQRGAINLVGVHHGEIHRGQELSSIGHLLPSRILTVSLQMVEGASRGVKDRQRIRFHVGTAESMANVRLLGDKKLEPGRSGWAQVFLAEPVVSVWNQPFVIRSESPVETIGGGRIAHPNASRLDAGRSADIEMVNQLTDRDEQQRAAAAVYFKPIYNTQLAELTRIVGVSGPAEAIESLVAAGDLVAFRLSPQKTMYIHALRGAQLGDQIRRCLQRMHEQNPLASGFAQQEIENHFLYLETRELFEFVLQQLIQDKSVQRLGKLYALEGYGPSLSAGEKKLLADIVQRYKSADMAPPSVKELQKEIVKNRQSVPQLVQLARDQGELVQLDDQLFMHQQTVDGIKRRLTELMNGGKGITLSDIRQHLGTTRKYAVPLCEHLDEIGFTRRDGDLRFLGNQ